MHFTFHIVKLKLNEMENTSTEMHCALLIFIRIYFVITLSLFFHIKICFQYRNINVSSKSPGDGGRGLGRYELNCVANTVNI